MIFLKEINIFFREASLSKQITDQSFNYKKNLKLYFNFNYEFTEFFLQSKKKLKK